MSCGSESYTRGKVRKNQLSDTIFVDLWASSSHTSFLVAVTLDCRSMSESNELSNRTYNSYQLSGHLIKRKVGAPQLQCRV